MSDTAVAVTTKSAGTGRATARRGVLFLVISFALVLAGRLLLYAWLPDRVSDFDLLYDAANRLLRGENPYGTTMQRFPYPLPAVLLAVPFTRIPLELARPIFDILIGWAFAYALWRYRGTYALLAMASGAYLFAMAKGQTTPLMVAASLVPALGFLLAVRPNTSISLWIARPSWRVLLGASAFLVVSLVVLPSWPRDWWVALPPDTTPLVPPVMRPFGFLLLLAAIRWRSPEGRLLFAIAFVPQTTLPYELVPLALIPANRLEMGIYLAGTWIAVAAADRLHLNEGIAEWAATGWPVTLGAVYLPMLYLVLRRPTTRSGRTTEKERRRRHRLADHELTVDVSQDGEGGVVVRVTHLPTRLFTEESGRTRKLAERKAHDRLAAILAERRRGSEKGSTEPK